MEFTTVTTKELEQIGKAKLSGAATQVYLALRLHAWGDKVSCFPSIGRISKLLGEAYTTRTIQRALVQLETSGLIKRNKAHTQNRFDLLAKKAAETIKDTAKKLTSKKTDRRTETSPEYIKKKNQNYKFCNSRKKERKYIKKSPKRPVTIQEFRVGLEGLSIPQQLQPAKINWIDKLLRLESEKQLTQQSIDDTFTAGKAFHDAIWKENRAKPELETKARLELGTHLEILPEQQHPECIERKMKEMVLSEYPETRDFRLWEAINNHQ